MSIWSILIMIINFPKPNGKKNSGTDTGFLGERGMGGRQGNCTQIKLARFCMEVSFLCNFFDFYETCVVFFQDAS